jgi:hypothetical protein
MGYPQLIQPAVWGGDEHWSDCCAPSMQPPQRMHIASVMKQCSGYELAVVVMNLLYTLPLTSHHNNKDVHKGATL